MIPWLDWACARKSAAGCGARPERANPTLLVVFLTHSRITCRAGRYKGWGLWSRGLAECLTLLEVRSNELL